MAEVRAGQVRVNDTVAVFVVATAGSVPPAGQAPRRTAGMGKAGTRFALSHCTDVKSLTGPGQVLGYARCAGFRGPQSPAVKPARRPAEIRQGPSTRRQAMSVRKE